MKKIVLQVHDIKDPVNYAVVFLTKVQQVVGKLEVIIVIPSNSQRVVSNINPTFKYKIMVGTDFIDETSSISIQENLDLENCVLQQKVYEKVGKVVPLNTIIKKQIAYKNFYRKLLAIYEPDLCVCWNGQVHIDQTSFRDIVKELNIPLLFLERGLIPKSIFYDFQGVNATSSVAYWNKFDSLNESTIERYNLIKQYIKKEGVAVVKLKQEKIKFKSPYILFPLQRDSDSNLVSNSKYFKNMYSILKELNETKLPIDIHYRAHPEDPKNHYTKLLEFNNAKLREESNVDLEQHLKFSEAIMTINSTIGFSALLNDKVVITLGESLYSGKGFTLDYKDFSSFEDIISTAKKVSFDKDTINRKNSFITRLIIDKHLVFGHSHLSFIQLNSLKDLLEKMLGE